MGGFGFPSPLLQFPHFVVSGVDVNGFGLMLAIGFSTEGTEVMRMIRREKDRDSESDNEPSHFSTFLSLPCIDIIPRGWLRVKHKSITILLNRGPAKMKLAGAGGLLRTRALELFGMFLYIFHNINTDVNRRGLIEIPPQKRPVPNTIFLSQYPLPPLYRC